MPRKARKKSEIGIYHIIMRGINRRSIFEDGEDCIKFIQTIQCYKEKSSYELYVYCLIGNNVHIFNRSKVYSAGMMIPYIIKEQNHLLVNIT